MGQLENSAHKHQNSHPNRHPWNRAATNGQDPARHRRYQGYGGLFYRIYYIYIIIFNKAF